MNILQRRFMRVAAAAVVLLLSGCWGLPLIGESVDFDESDSPVGTPKATVRERIGQPKYELRDEGASYFVYEVSGEASGLGIIMFLWWPILPLPVSSATSNCVLFEFDAQNLVKRYEIKKDVDVGASIDCRTAFWPQEQIAVMTRDEILPRAEQGDAEAQFQLYRVSRPSGKSLTWLCLAANQGYAPAQEELGKLHAGFFSGKYGGDWSDAGFAEPDHVRAYMWHSLAAANGEPRAGSSRDYLADQMTPAQIAEAERLAAEWKPGDCGAEDRTAESTK